jgi:hypothetical protein
MNDSAVLVDETLEEAPSPTIPAAEAASIQPRKPKRFFSNIRFNAVRYLVLTSALGLTWGLIRAAMSEGAGSPLGTFMLALAGGLMAAAAKTAVDLLHWADETRQAAHVERMRAVQRVYQRARTVREHAVLDWRRVHTILVDHLTGSSQEIRLFRNHDETDRHADALVRKALSEDLWIRADGIDAVQRFKSEIAAIDYDGIPTEADFLAEFNAHMNTLRHELALAAVGISLD